MIRFEKDDWFQACKSLIFKEDVLQDLRPLQNYTNLEELTLSGDFKIQENSFDDLKNLKYLKLEVKSYDFPEFLFKNLSNLKKLSLIYETKFLNNNHFCGLVSLESLEITLGVNGKIENLLNLKELTLNDFQFEEFSFKNFKNLETLKLEYPDFNDEPPKDLFIYLTSLKNLTYNEDYYDESRDDEIGLMIELFSNIPTNVEHFDCHQFIFNLFDDYEIPFIYNVKSLVIHIHDLIDFNFLFLENLFPCLESIEFSSDADAEDISIDLFKRIKNLKVLQLKGLKLVGIDKEFNYLENFYSEFQAPNISNFSNRSKNCA